MENYSGAKKQIQWYLAIPHKKATGDYSDQEIEISNQPHKFEHGFCERRAFADDGTEVRIAPYVREEERGQFVKAMSAKLTLEKNRVHPILENPSVVDEMETEDLQAVEQQIKNG